MTWIKVHYRSVKLHGGIITTDCCLLVNKKPRVIVAGLHSNMATIDYIDIRKRMTPGS